MFNKTDQNHLPTSEQAIKQFIEDWNNPSYTQIELNPIDINDILEKYYNISQPLHFTRDMLWEVERKKAWDPKTYIPHVVCEGESWGKAKLENGDDTFIRWSNQLQWTTNNYGIVIERVHLVQNMQKAIFIGIDKAIDNYGNTIHAATTQALFHVEHGVGGTDDHPLNTWRIVHLTSTRNLDIINAFNKFRDNTTLPSYIEIYIKKDLGIDITRRV